MGVPFLDTLIYEWENTVWPDLPDSLQFCNSLDYTLCLTFRSPVSWIIVYPKLSTTFTGQNPLTKVFLTAVQTFIDSTIWTN
jgi:hypothetical protein